MERNAIKKIYPERNGNRIKNRIKNSKKKD